MRVKTTRRRVQCPHCKELRWEWITARAARGGGFGFPQISCFDCMCRLAIERQRKLEERQHHGNQD